VCGATYDHFDVKALLGEAMSPVTPATPRELERRREIVQRILQRRERIGPIGIRADDLVHESRADWEKHWR
jgi:hypothetical protein